MVGILAVGTEITTGQILNTNTQWLSSELLELGIKTTYQIAVPDQTDEIKAALKFLQNHCSILIVTGGLGPTADDFTRKILAETYARPLLWNEDNWNKVQAKLNSKGVRIRPIHRQQCEFPEGSTILSNEAGIADGFMFQISHSNNVTINPTEIYALPGPPKELLSIWQNHIRDRLSALVPDSQKWVQKLWTTKGLPESEVASLVNDALGEAGVNVLYRAYTPFIDVKLLYMKKDAKTNETLGLKISQILGPWLNE